MSKTELIVRMTDYLEDACACLAIGEREMFYYHAGKAKAIECILDDMFIGDDEYMDEHIQNMLDIIDEHIQNMLDIIDENW